MKILKYYFLMEDMLGNKALFGTESIKDLDKFMKTNGKFSNSIGRKRLDIEGFESKKVYITIYSTFKKISFNKVKNDKSHIYIRYEVTKEVERILQTYTIVKEKYLYKGRNQNTDFLKKDINKIKKFSQSKLEEQIFTKTTIKYFEKYNYHGFKLDINKFEIISVSGEKWGNTAKIRFYYNNREYSFLKNEFYKANFGEIFGSDLISDYLTPKEVFNKFVDMKSASNNQKRLFEEDFDIQFNLIKRFKVNTKGKIVGNSKVTIFCKILNKKFEYEVKNLYSLSLTTEHKKALDNAGIPKYKIQYILNKAKKNGRDILNLEILKLEWNVKYNLYDYLIYIDNETGITRRVSTDSFCKSKKADSRTIIDYDPETGFYEYKSENAREVLGKCKTECYLIFYKSTIYVKIGSSYNSITRIKKFSRSFTKNKIYKTFVLKSNSVNIEDKLLTGLKTYKSNQNTKIKLVNGTEIFIDSIDFRTKILDILKNLNIEIPADLVKYLSKKPKYDKSQQLSSTKVKKILKNFSNIYESSSISETNKAYLSELAFKLSNDMEFIENRSDII